MLVAPARKSNPTTSYHGTCLFNNTNGQQLTIAAANGHFHSRGTERVVMWLAQTLKKLGHTVTVFAAPGSTMPEGIGCETDVARLASLSKNFDVIHGKIRKF